MPPGRAEAPVPLPACYSWGYSKRGEARGQRGHRSSPAVGKHPNGHGPGQPPRPRSCCGAMAPLRLKMVPRARATIWVLRPDCRVVPMGGGGHARLCDGPVPAPGGLGSIARGLSRLSKIISPGLNCITWCTGSIAWGWAAYSISVPRAGACGAPSGQRRRDGLCLRHKPSGFAAQGRPTLQDEGPPAQTSPGTAGCVARPLPRAAERLLPRLSPPAPV